jgi:hypothetical protein
MSNTHLMLLGYKCGVTVMIRDTNLLHVWLSELFGEH